MSGPGPRHPASAARRRVVAVAGHTGDQAVARAALSDGDASVRATALTALARIGLLGTDDAATAASDPDPVVRARVAELAGTLGPPAIDSTTALLRDRVATVVEAACFGLGEIGAPTADSSTAMAELDRVARSHSDPLCREAAVAAIGAIGDEAGLDAVLAAMTDKPAVRRRAVLALAAFEGPEVDAALERALEDRDWQVRQAAEDLTGRH